MNDDLGAPPSRPSLMRPAETYVYGLDGPVVVVPARVATWLLRRAGLEAYHREHRGIDPEVDAVITALKVADRASRGSVGTDCGTNADPTGSGPADSTWLNTAEVARALGISARGVRKAVATGRLRARQVGGVHVFSPEDVGKFRARRAAA